MKDYESSYRYFHLSLELDMSLVEANPGDAVERAALSVTYSDLGWALGQLGNPRQALDFYNKALSIRETLAAADPMDAHLRAMLANTYGRIGSILLRMDDTEQAAQYFMKQVRLNEGLVSTDPLQVANHTDLAEAYANTAALHMHLASKEPARSRAATRWREARDWYQKALSIYVRVRQQGLLHAEHAREPRRLEQEIERCNAALVQADT
jgi:tetratricopeptide (TPR) repeat protein